MHRIVAGNSLLFGTGEYESMGEDGSRTSIEEMRSHFLDRVSVHEPAVPSDLINQLLEEYQEIPLFCYEADPERRRNSDVRARMFWHINERLTWRDVEADITSGQGGYGRKIENFVSGLVDWSTSYNLDVVWCREHAFETLDLWYHYPKYRSERRWTYGLCHPPYLFRPVTLPDFSQSEFVFRFTTLYPSRGFRKEVRHEIAKEFEKQLNEFLDGREEEAREEGMAATPRKYTLEHFDWLVHRRVQRMPYTEIYRKYYPNEYQGIRDNIELYDRTKRIRKAVNELEGLLELTESTTGEIEMSTRRGLIRAGHQR
jgi:hypothetical protein